MKALESSQAEKIAEILIENGADSTAENFDGDSILQILIRTNKIEPARILIEKGKPNLEHFNKKTESVIHTTVLQKQHKLLKNMLSKNIDISKIMPDQNLEEIVVGGSALHIALSLQSRKCVDIIISKMEESDLEIAGDDENHSALDISIKNQWLDIAKKLLKLGAPGKKIFKIKLKNNKTREIKLSNVMISDI